MKELSTLKVGILILRISNRIMQLKWIKCIYLYKKY